MKKNIFYYCILLFILSCGKKSKPDNNNNNIANCNLSIETIQVNEIAYNILKDTAYSTQNNTYYSEHRISDGHGYSIDFAGTSLPNNNTYTITSSYSNVKSGTQNVYIQYYINSKTYVAQSGTLLVSGSAPNIQVEFCKIYFKESFGEEKTISTKTALQ